MKKFGLFIIMLLLAAAPAMATIGVTQQVWDFEQETLPFGMLPSVSLNPYGIPVAMVQDLSGTGVLAWNSGAWIGPEIKIIIDIPNQQLPNPLKILAVDMKYQGDMTFSWVADIVTGDHFTLIDPGVSIEADGWKTIHQTWLFEPNPREELVVIGLKASDIPGAFPFAAIDEIAITTICVPEPATLALLAAGAGFVLSRRRK